MKTKFDLNFARRLKKLDAKLYTLSHKYIKIRDPYCICCGAPTTDAGHFIHNRTIIDYDPRNLNGQCRHCNRFITNGNHEVYRVKLIERIGLANVEWLEAVKETLYHPSIEWYEGLIAWYQKKLKEVL
jgi:hypothetical protein